MGVGILVLMLEPSKSYLMLPVDSGLGMAKTLGQGMLS